MKVLSETPQQASLGDVLFGLRPKFFNLPPPSGSNQKCFPRCTFFQCGQRALTVKDGRPYCRWLEDYSEDLCWGCKYAGCFKNRLLTDGLCGFTVKKITNLADTLPDQEVRGVKVPNKLKTRLGEEELF